MIQPYTSQKHVFAQDNSISIYPVLKYLLYVHKNNGGQGRCLQISYTMTGEIVNNNIQKQNKTKRKTDIYVIIFKH